MKEVGERIKALAVDNGITLKDLSLRAGIPYRSMQNYASGKQLPGLEALTKIEEAVEVDLNWLLVGESKPTAGEQTIIVRPDLLQEIGEEIERQNIIEIFGFEPRFTYSIAALIYTDLLRRIDSFDIIHADFSDTSSKIFNEIKFETSEYIRRTKETIALYGQVGQSSGKAASEDATAENNSVSQTFEGDVGQVGGGDINNNFGEKD